MSSSPGPRVLSFNNLPQREIGETTGHYLDLDSIVALLHIQLSGALKSLESSFLDLKDLSGENHHVFTVNLLLFLSPSAQQLDVAC